LFALRENSSSEDWQKIADALEPPRDWIDPATNAPQWYGDDDDAWAEFERAMRA